MAASAAYGFRPSVVDGRGAFSVRRAAGEEDHRSGTARSAPGASGTLHPFNCPGGEHGLRLQAVIGGRRRSLCREPRSRKSEGYARWCFTSPAHPSSCPCGRNPRRRMRFAASGRHKWTDAEPLPCVAQPGKRIIAVEQPGTRRARVVREVVRCIRPIARAANAVCGFSPSLVDGGGAFAVRRAAGKVRDTRDGILRLRHIRPVARAGGIHGGEHGLRLQAVVNGRTRSLCRASRGRESGTAFYTSGTSVQSPVRAESAAAASTACSFRPSSMDGRGAFPCATQSRKE